MNKLSRKEFVKLTARGSAFLPFLHTSLPRYKGETRLAPEGEKSLPWFKFVQVNDLHVQDDYSRYAAYSSKRVGPTYEGANLRASWLLSALKNDPLFNGVDFVLGIGDLVHGEQLEAIRYDIDFFASNIYERLPVPLYPAVGNHENRQSEGDPVYEEPYKQLFGKDKVNYSFVHKGLHFIVINNSGSWSVNDEGILNNRLALLSAMLNEHPQLPKIICCHIPLVPVRQKEILAKSFGFASYYTKEQEILGVLEQSKDKILAVLSGHLHLSAMVNVQSIYHIVLSGLASYPHDLAIYSVYDDRIDVELARVPSDLLFPNTNIHGAKRFGIDYADDLHPDYTSYIMGNAMERRFSIPLKKS